MQLKPLPMEAILPERIVSEDAGWPVSAFESRMEGFLGGVSPWHWHRPAQFLRVLEGSVAVDIPGSRLVLESGQGCFLNGSALHRLERLGERARILVVVFDPALVAGGDAGPLYAQYVQPLLQSRTLVRIPLTGEAPWHADALERISKTVDIVRRQDFGWELDARHQLTEAWMALVRAWGASIHRGGRIIREQRVRAMLSYVRQHLTEPMRLEEMSAAAGISPRECTRCFRDVLGISAVEHVTLLRVRAAARMLEEGSESLGRVGEAAGFSSSSYFGKVFRQLTGYTPRDYRKAARRAAAPEERGPDDADPAG